MFSFKSIATILLCCGVAICPLAAAEKKVSKESSKEEKEIEMAKISQALGHLIGKNLQTLGVNLDVAQIVKGLNDASSGKDSPLSDLECMKAISTLQEHAFKEQSEKNLASAISFLEKNRKEKGIVNLEEGKLQYKIEKTGKGAIVEAHTTPIIRYTGKFLDGTVFGCSKEDEPFYLDEAVPGFSKGLVGMKEGEKRTLFIHPDLAYGTHGLLPPNSLLTFEVELVKANAPKSEEGLTTTAHPREKGKEVASEVKSGDIR